jgi:hypothetical protein
VLGVVGDADDDALAFPGDELGAGELPVHRDDALGGAQPCHIRHCHLHHCQGSSMVKATYWLASILELAS